MKLAVTTASGIEAVTKRELYKLGVEESPSIFGKIDFEGDEELLANCNLRLSSASRVYVILKEFNCKDFDELYDNVYDINWGKYLTQKSKIIIEPKLVESKINAFSATQSICKKAICERLKRDLKCEILAENGERNTVRINITHDFCSVMLDTSGDSLNKRGYRKLYGEAQLKETLASAMIDLSVWKPDRPFADLFTGTGTIAIEAGLKLKNKAPGLDRDFDFLHFKWFDKKIFDDCKKQAISQIDDNITQKIVAYDTSESQLSLAHYHAKRAGVSDIIEFKNDDMRTFLSPLKRGVAISNPPYGERLEDRQEIESLYKDYGKVKSANPDWCFYTLTSVTDFERLFGYKADKKRKLYNGRMECCYYSHLAKIKK